MDFNKNKGYVSPPPFRVPLSEKNFQVKLNTSLKVASELQQTVRIAKVELDQLEQLEITSSFEALFLLEKELEEELKKFITPQASVGKIKRGCYYIYSCGPEGKDYEFISEIEFLRRRFEKKVIRSDTSKTSTFFFKFTLSAGISTTEAQKTYDSKKLLKFSDFALSSSQTRGPNLIRAASSPN